MRGDTEPNTHVLIVGAGPAGLACAIASARQGLQVELIDAMRPPIDKACGEGLMPDSLQSLAALGFDLDHDFSRIETHPLRGIRFIGNSKCHTHSTSADAAFHNGCGRGIRRTLLHQLLLNRAIRLGVRFHWDNSVRNIVPGMESTLVLTNSQSFRARYLIGADGPQSKVAAAAGLTEASVHSRRIGLRQHYAISPWTDFVEVYWSEYGQAYVTPISSAEVCVAFIARSKISSPDEALTHYPALQRRLAQAQASDKPRGSITLGRRLSRVTSGNVALIGDASGSVDAVTGEGLALCFRQATALSLALKNNDLAAYQQAHRRIHRLPTLMSRSLLLLDRFPRLRARVLDGFEHHPKHFDGLLQVHIGQSPIKLLGTNGLLAAGLHVLNS